MSQVELSPEHGHVPIINWAHDEEVLHFVTLITTCVLTP